MEWYNKHIRVNGRKATRLFHEFEIGLSRSILRANPADIKALQLLGYALTKARRYEEALEIDKKIVKLQPEEAIAYYNLACSFSNLGQIDKALSAIKKAIKFGYRDWKQIMKDPDLKNLRKNTRLLEEIDKFIEKLCKQLQQWVRKK